MKKPLQIWQHGVGAIVEHPAHMMLVRHSSDSIRVVGMAGSTNWLHYPLVTQQLKGQSSLRILRIMLRYRCDSTTALITNIVLHDAENNIFKAAGLNLCAFNWDEMMLLVDQEITVGRGLNLSIGIRFDGADDETHALEISGVGLEINEAKYPAQKQQKPDLV